MILPSFHWTGLACKKKDTRETGGYTCSMGTDMQKNNQPTNQSSIWPSPQLESGMSSHNAEVPEIKGELLC